MFCKKCGTVLDDNVKFCAKCGTSINAEDVPSETVKETKNVDNNVVKSVLKPTFNYGYKICSIIGRILLFFLILGLYLLEEIDLLWKHANEIEKFQVVPVIIIATVIIYILIRLFFEKKQYENLEYNFYNNKLEYIDGFINKEKKRSKI